MAGSLYDKLTIDQHTSISLLAHTAYLAEKELIRENSTSLVHLAELHSPINGHIDAFVKAFPAKISNNALKNELVSYVYARHAGLPVAAEAFILILEAERLFGIHPKYKHLLASEDGLVLTWATRAIMGSPIRYLHPVREPELQQRLKKWPGLPRVLAYDDLLINEDRTADNLVAIRNGEFVLVDHAEIAGGMFRDINSLSPFLRTQNRLVNDLFGNEPPLHIKNGMVFAAEQHHQIFRLAAPEIEYWLNKLFPSTNQDNKALLRFLGERCVTSATRIKQQYGVLL